MSEHFFIQSTASWHGTYFSQQLDFPAVHVYREKDCGPMKEPGFSLTILKLGLRCATDCSFSTKPFKTWIKVWTNKIGLVFKIDLKVLLGEVFGPCQVSRKCCDSMKQKSQVQFPSQPLKCMVWVSPAFYLYFTATSSLHFTNNMVMEASWLTVKQTLS